MTDCLYQGDLIMGLWSKQQIFCNACGREMFVELNNVVGRDYKTCSMECNREIKRREVLSLLGKEYYPDPNVVRAAEELLADHEAKDNNST